MAVVALRPMLFPKTPACVNEGRIARDTIIHTKKVDDSCLEGEEYLIS